MSASDYDRDIASALRKARRDLRISQAVLAEHLGISPQSIHKIERHQMHIFASQLYLAAEKLGVSIEALFSIQKKLKVSQREKHLRLLAEIFNQIGNAELQLVLVNASRAFAKQSLLKTGAALTSPYRVIRVEF